MEFINVIPHGILSVLFLSCYLLLTIVKVLFPQDHERAFFDSADWALGKVFHVCESCLKSVLVAWMNCHRGL